MDKKKLLICLIGLIILAVIGSIVVVIINTNNNKVEVQEEVQNEIQEVVDDIGDYNIVITPQNKTITSDNGKFEIALTNYTVKVTNEKNKEVAKKLEDFLNDKTYTYKEEDFKKDLNSMVYVDGNEKQIFNMKQTLSITFKNKDILSVKYELKGNEGNVTWITVRGYIFNLENGEQIPLSDIGEHFTAFKNIVLEQAKKEAIAKYGESNLYEGYEERLQEIFDNNHYYFSNNGMYFEADKYSLTEGSEGNLSVLVDYDLLKPEIKSGILTKLDLDNVKKDNVIFYENDNRVITVETKLDEYANSFDGYKKKYNKTRIFDNDLELWVALLDEVYIYYDSNDYHAKCDIIPQGKKVSDIDSSWINNNKVYGFYSTDNKELYIIYINEVIKEKVDVVKSNTNTINNSPSIRAKDNKTTNTTKEPETKEVDKSKFTIYEFKQNSDLKFDYVGKQVVQGLDNLKF